MHIVQLVARVSEASAAGNPQETNSDRTFTKVRQVSLENVAVSLFPRKYLDSRQI